MKKLGLISLVSVALGASLIPLNNKKPQEIKGDFAPPGMVAYAASYSSDATSEPNWSTQNSKTFQYLNLGSALNTYRGDSVKVGIIDSGINYDHEDFMVSGSTKVKPQSKYWKYQNSQWEYYSPETHSYSYIDDTLGHGTNVAATVAAAINGVGGLGLAPNVELYVYKVTNSNNGYEFGAIQSALTDAVSLGIKIINMSFQSYENAVSYGGSSMAASSGCSSILTSWLNTAHNNGITLIGAAGNYNTSEPSYPGSNNYVINVGSLDQTGTGKAGFSNYGSTIDLVAPGYVYVADEASNTAYTNTSGTSFSAPLVTAACALYKQKYPSATPAQIEAALYASCDEIDDSGSEYYNWAGHGKLNIKKLLQIDCPTSITITNSEIVNNQTSLEVGKTLQLTQTVSGNGTFDDSVTYSLQNNTGAISVNNTGKITALSEGTDTVVVTSTVDSNVFTSVQVTVTPSTIEPETLTITRSSFSTSGGYNWYTWTESSTDNTSISGKAELYTTTTTSMQFNKSKGNSQAALFNTTAIPGSITKIEATSATSTARSWTAYVTSTACSLSSNTLVFGNNKTTVGTTTPAVGTSTSFGTSNAGYSYFCLQEGVSSASYLSEIKVTYVPKSVSSISIKTAPTKTTYEAGENFDPTGLVITKTFSDNTTQDVSYASDSSNFTFNPSTAEALTTDITAVTIGYGGKTTTQSITVTAPKILSSISISGQTTSFVEGDAFSFGGTVTAHYNDSTENVTSSATFTDYNMTTLGNQSVTVSYTYKGVTKTTAYSINIGKGTPTSLSLSGQTTTYFKNNIFSFDGTCTVHFANGYEKIVTPTSVSSPDMSSSGNKTITVTFTYNGITVSTDYQITVNSNRVVIEETTSQQEAVLGTITYPNNTETISISTLSTSTGGYTTYESNSIRLGSGSNTGSITVTSTTSNITKVVVSAKSYGSDSSVHLTVGGTDNTITSSYANYTKQYSTPTNSCAIATTASKKRAHIQTISVYYMKDVTVETDISTTEDCVGLETFIDTYLHMSYVENLGYCKDTEHHYYSTAKAEFNKLNNHQRSLFTSNSAYSNEWARLSAWAEANGESLNGSNQLGSNSKVILFNSNNNSGTSIIVVVSLLSIITISSYYFIKKRKEN